MALSLSNRSDSRSKNGESILNVSLRIKILKFNKVFNYSGSDSDKMMDVLREERNERMSATR